MHSDEICAVFDSRGIIVPDFILEKISNPEYDWHEGWCCGLVAIPKDEGILLRAYCRRHRGGDHPQWIINKDGSVGELERLSADWPTWDPKFDPDTDPHFFAVDDDYWDDE